MYKTDLKYISKGRRERSRRNTRGERFFCSLGVIIVQRSTKVFYFSLFVKKDFVQLLKFTTKTEKVLLGQGQTATFLMKMHKRNKKICAFQFVSQKQSKKWEQDDNVSSVGNLHTLLAPTLTEHHCLVFLPF